MKPKQKVILFLQYFGTGIMQPIMALMLISRGCNLQSLPLVLAAYGITAFCLELPSGIYADRKGRKHTFLLSTLIYCGSLMLVLLSRGMVGAVCGMVLYGAARAFASGSLDALIIDDFLERKGEECLHEVTSQMSVIVGCGIAAGALTGGLLPSAASYSAHLLLRVFLLCALGTMVVLWIPRDTPDAPAETDEPRHTLRSITGIRFTPPLFRLLLSVTCLTAIMAAVETYWTPALKAIAPQSTNAVLGVLSAASFFLLTLGSMAMGHLRIKSNIGRWNAYFLMQMLLGAGVLLLALQGTALGFAAAFLLFYFLLGADDVQEQTLLNTLADSGNRAATLSAASLMQQLGGMGASAVCSITVLGLGFEGVWKLIGTFSIAVFAILWLLTLSARKNL